MNAPTGGTDKTPGTGGDDTESRSNSLAITGQKRSAQIQLGEARVERDPETGKILRVIRADEDEMVEIAGRKRKKTNPLDDPLNELSEVEEEFSPLNTDTGATTKVVSALELQAAAEEEKVKKRNPRHQSKREEEWLARLVEKYGDNLPAMVRDRKLNPMQQTEGDIRRRLRKWKEKNQK